MGDGSGRVGADLRVRDGILVSAAVGLATGVVEGFHQYLKRFVFEDPDYLGGATVGPEVVWLVPITTTLIFVLVGGALCLFCCYVWPRRLRLAYLALPLLSLSLFILSRTLLPRVVWWAAALLAVGVATRVAHSGRSAALPAIRRLAAVCMVALIVVVAGAAVLTGRRGGYEGSPHLAAGERPNVLLIILDTVRAANMSLYGYERPTTPVLEGLSDSAITFDLAFASSSWTLPTHGSFFTGRYPHEMTTDWLTPLDDTFPTLAEWLGSHGYATGGFVANMGVCGEQFGLSRGFEHYDAVPISWRVALQNTWLTREILMTIRRRLGIHRRFIRKNAAEVNESFLAWAANTEQPFFAFLNYFDAHEPYGPPPDWPLEFSPPGNRYWFVTGRQHTEEELAELQNAYDDGIRYIDAQIGVLLDALSDSGTLDNTVVIITSDHGEEFGEHGFRGHGNSLYRNVIHVPLLIIAPGSDASGVRVTRAVGLDRLAATVVDMTGLADDSPFPGVPLVLADSAAIEAPADILSEVTSKPRRPPGGWRALIDQEYHYIDGPEGEELFALSDPGQTRDLALAPEGPRLLESFRARLEAIVTAER